MIKKLFQLSFFIMPWCSFSQAWFNLYPYETSINFDDTVDLQYLTIDTISNPNNIWQIGSPQKVTFTSANSNPNVIVTDTINSYPANDTSSFILFHEFVIGSNDFFLSGYYYSDTDSLNDFGKIELSHDLGNSWILISDDTSEYQNWNGDTVNWPILFNLTLTGNSGGWQQFFIQLDNSYYIFDADVGDTIFFRFTFITDVNSEVLDGLMFDDLLLVDVLVFGIEENVESPVIIFPNPASDEIQILNVNSEIASLRILSLDGKEVYQKTKITDYNIPITFLEAGTYLIFIETEEGDIYSQKFIKQ